MADVQLGPVLAASGGVLLIWSGARGAPVTTALRQLLSGQSPAAPRFDVAGSLGPAPSKQEGGGGPGGGGFGGSGGGTVKGQAIADDALRYKGQPYLWGGGRPGGWDCSGFCNWVIGRDLGLAIPGYKAGSWHGQWHGPPTWSWASWGGCAKITRSVLAPGDLVIWPAAHMGIAIGGGRMISALDPALGTQVTTIESAHSGGPVYRRLK